MLVGAAPWQDYVLADAEPTLAGVIEIVPITGYNGRWWRMVENMTARHGGDPVSYIPRTPSGTILPIFSSPVICNLMDLKPEGGEGDVSIIVKKGVIAAREWYVNRLFASRPQRGDRLETGYETFHVEHVTVVRRKAPDGVTRDLKFQLALSGASHRR